MLGSSSFRGPPLLARLAADLSVCLRLSSLFAPTAAPPTGTEDGHCACLPYVEQPDGGRVNTALISSRKQQISSNIKKTYKESTMETYCSILKKCNDMNTYKKPTRNLQENLQETYKISCLETRHLGVWQFPIWQQACQACPRLPGVARPQGLPAAESRYRQVGGTVARGAGRARGCCR